MPNTDNEKLWADDTTILEALRMLLAIGCRAAFDDAEIEAEFTSADFDHRLFAITVFSSGTTANPVVAWDRYKGACQRLYALAQSGPLTGLDPEVRSELALNWDAHRPPGPEARVNPGAADAMIRSGDDLEGRLNHLYKTLYDSTEITPQGPTFGSADLTFWGMVEFRDGGRQSLLLDNRYASDDWDYWGRWNQQFIDGTPLSWAEQRDVLRIPSEAWEQGAKALNDEIAGVEALSAVRQALADLDAAHRNHQSDVRGTRGGNNPPEEFELPEELRQQTTIIWAKVDEIRTEVESDQPDKRRVAVALDALKQGLIACLDWIGRKSDLAVDSAIKWSIPVGGAAYLAENPEKLATLIDAVERWLTFLN